MTAEQILSISKCGDLFSNNIDATKTKYKELVKEWHPDSNKNPKAQEVFQKITELYNAALKLFKQGT